MYIYIFKYGRIFIEKVGFFNKLMHRTGSRAMKNCNSRRDLHQNAQVLII